jgi:hydrogenase maturation protein HypF
MALSLKNENRRLLRIRGLVQGVGFRPFAHRLALLHGLRGFVRNDSAGVWIEIEGDGAALDAFQRDLGRSTPPAARILELAIESIPPVGESSFRIERSVPGSRPDPEVSPDLATCPDCLNETLGLRDRRRGYAFTSCSHCGPRFTMQGSVPYDRERTSMAEFPLCPRCKAEYDDPDDRRHHAEGTACPACGPRVRLLGRDGQEIDTNVPIREAACRLRLGQIVAVKGLGGFHLACLARSEEAVLTLRVRKGRDEKPFAVMVRDVEGARRLCDLTAPEEALLSGPERPIVLLRRRADASVAGAVAPGNPLLGVLLPYTPLHHLILRELDGAPIVLTSGNPSDLPIAVEDAEALRSLGRIADAFLTHDRSIRSRSDDSVARVMAGETLVLRRSRGYSPAPVLLPIELSKKVLALGGALKATVALGRGKEAILSQHLGDLEAYEAYRAYGASIEHYERLFQFRPDAIVHDLHPDYPSTSYALARAATDGLDRIAVQHHHAHVASCMAENGLEGPVIGVAFDGSGYGSDGAIWGGEFLVGDYRSVRRAGHFDYVSMPGGEAAIREPWRMAAAYLVQAGEDLSPLYKRIPERSLGVALQLLRRNVNAPRTSSCGRLFDGVAALLGIRDRVSYEGQAAIELEWLAQTSRADGSYPVEISPDGIIRTSPIVSGVLGELRKGVRPGDIARRFHRTIAEVLRRMCLELRDKTGLGRVALSGGVFMNELLLEDSLERLQREGFRVYRHRLVPPNDGGLALGQLAVAAAGGGR